MEKEGGIKTEPITDMPPDHNDTSSFDYNRLYGELYRKLLTTPVQDIFHPAGHVTPSTGSPATMSRSSQPISAASAMDVHPGGASPKSSGIPHPAFPFPVQSIYPGTNGSESNFQDSLNSMIFGTPPSKISRVKIEAKGAQLRDDSAPQSPEIQNSDQMYSGSIQDDMDVGALVEKFRVTLEKYGVSQRFAARYIMQDTSQGNLSFLIEKGRNKKWHELSPRGRVPYLKMRSWLESKEQQMWTLDMLKQAQEMKKAGPRDAYNRRERFSMFQLTVLCRLFEENSNPPMDVRNAVAERLNIPLDRVNVWFQNQRARGFPAKKMLQQSTFNENQGVPKLKASRGVHKPESHSLLRRKTIGDVPNVQEGKCDFSIWQSSMSDISSVQPVFPDLRNRIPLEHKHIQSSEHIPDQSAALPLDLSSSKQESDVLDRTIDENVNLSKEMSSMEKVNGYLDHIDRVHLGSSFSHTSIAQSQHKQTGAAKRKRGNVYKHVSPHASTSESNFPENYLPKTTTVDDHCSITDQSSKKIKRCDDDETELRSSENQPQDQTGYNNIQAKTAIIKQESINQFVSEETDENNSGSKSEHSIDYIMRQDSDGRQADDVTSAKHSEVGSRDGSESARSTKAACENDVNAKVSELVKVFEDGESVSPETIDQFKSFCASLLMKNKTDRHKNDTGST